MFDPDSTAAHATFVVQEGTFSFSGGGIAATDGAFAIKTPSATLHVDGASGAGRVECDGGTMVTYLRADDVGDGAIRVSNPAVTQILDSSYEVTTVDDYFSVPSNIFRLGPRDAIEHFGDALAPLPDALAMMPESLLSTARGADPASRSVAAEAEENGFAEERDLSLGLEGDIQVDRETVFEIAARKAAIARSARDAADEALGDAVSAENAARKQAADAGDLADAKQQDADNLRAEALQVFQESQKRDDAFESAIRQVETAQQQEEAARAVAEIDLAEGQAAERLATAEETVRLALEAAEQARAEALAILKEAKQKEEAFAEAQQAAENAKEEEESRALAVAEADDAEEAAAAALRAAEAAAELASKMQKWQCVLPKRRAHQLKL